MNLAERFGPPVSSADELASLIGTPSELVIRKQLASLDSHMIAFLDESPFLLLGTVGRDGSCDVSPRGDLSGLTRVLDPKTLIIPDRKGNRRADSLRNIIETGQVGLLYLVPGLGETLRINGRAIVTKDPAVLEPLAVDGKVPIVGIAVEIEEAYFQCAKAVIRSRLWEQRTDTRSRPSFAQILMEETKLEGETVESLQKRIDESYACNLY